MKPILPFLPALKTLPASVVPLCAVALFLSAPSATAADFVWTGTVDEFWAEDGNWNLTGFPEAGDTASISGAGVDLGGPQTADRLTLSSGASLFNSGSGGLTVGAGINGNSSPIVSLSGNGTTISAPVTFGTVSANSSNLFHVDNMTGGTMTLSGAINLGTQTANGTRLLWQENNSSANVVLSGNISGFGSNTTLLIRPSSGSVTLSGNNTFTLGGDIPTVDISGGTTGSHGVVYVSSATAFGDSSNNVRIPGGNGTLAQDRSVSLLITEPGMTISNTLNPQQAVVSIIGGNNTSGTVTWSGTITLTRRPVDSGDPLPIQFTAAAGGTVEISGQIHQGGPGFNPPIEKIGEGTVIFSRAGGTGIGTGAPGGSTTVKAGTLLVTNTSGSATGITSVLVESGAILGGTGRIAPTVGTNDVTVQSGGFLLGGMGDAAAGALEIAGDLNFDSGSTIRLVLGSGYENSSLERDGGTWTFATNQQFDFTLLSGAELGTYENIITGLASDPGVGSWLVTTPGFGGSFFTYDPGIDPDTGSIHLELIPEPSASLLLLLGIAILLYRRRGMFTRPVS